MQKVRLGKTELVAAEVGFGGIPIIPLAFDEAVRIVRHCYERGINFFDSANAYGDSEKKIGEALSGVRDKVILATKTGRRDADGAAKHIARSLENLKTDRLDIYQFHNVANEEALNQILAPGGAYEAVSRARDEGKIRFISFSSHDIATSVKACRTGLFSTVQFPFNFIESDPADELHRVALDLDMGVIGMKPMGGGLLERVDLCFKFLQQYPYSLPIPGIAAISEIDEILDLYDRRPPLTEADRRDIAAIRAELGTRFCHRCGYCTPCEQAVQIPVVLGFKASARRLSPPVVMAMVKEAMAGAENCTECEECLEKCPYHLPIPELLKENIEAYRAYAARHGLA
jgi:hypothetical protein